MTSRKIPLITGEVYHVFNRSIAKETIFLTQKHYERMIELMRYYIFLKPTLRYSYYKRLVVKQKKEFLLDLQKHKSHVQIYTYCLMPNHFHFLLKQTEDNGISKFVGNIQNSYAKYLNTKHKRNGAIFQEMFKAVHVETDEQMLHVMRYILLNPYTAHIITYLEELETYPWSSFSDLLGKKNSFINTSFIKNYFHSNQELEKFIYDQAEYQRELNKIKHLILDEDPYHPPSV